MRGATGTSLTRNGQIVDGPGAASLANGAVVIRDGQITFVGQEANAPRLFREATTIDARDGTLWPFFVDCVGLDPVTVIKR
jgi:imidazolonepropionase-like amidohydrolase